MEALARLVADFTRDLPRTLLNTLADDLVAARHDDQAAIRQAASQIHLGRAKTDFQELLDHALEQDVSPAELALAIRASLIAYENSREDLKAELVWTGPSPPATTLRRTDQALLQVCLLYTSPSPRD